MVDIIFSWLLFLYSLFLGCSTVFTLLFVCFYSISNMTHWQIGMRMYLVCWSFLLCYGFWFNRVQFFQVNFFFQKKRRKKKHSSTVFFLLCSLFIIIHLIVIVIYLTSQILLQIIKYNFVYVWVWSFVQFIDWVFVWFL